MCHEVDGGLYIYTLENDIWLIDDDIASTLCYKLSILICGNHIPAACFIARIIISWRWIRCMECVWMAVPEIKMSSWHVNPSVALSLPITSNSLHLSVSGHFSTPESEKVTLPQISSFVGDSRLQVSSFNFSWESAPRYFVSTCLSFLMYCGIIIDFVSSFLLLL